MMFKMFAFLIMSTSITMGSSGQCPGDGPHGCTCTEVPTFYVKCTGVNLTQIPADLPSKVIDLTLSGNAIYTVSKVTRSSLQKMYLNGNKVKDIQADAFDLLSELQVLNIDDNELVTLDGTMFTGLHSLEILSIKNNDITTLASATFNGEDLTNIMFIRLSFNKLTSIDDNAFNRLSTLLHLDLASNDLVQIGDFQDTEALPSLQRLQLANNQIAHFRDNQFSGLKNLKELVANNNQLSTLPKLTFAGLEQTLEDVYLGSNDLSPTLGGVFQSLERLQVLQISDNQLHWLNKNFVIWEMLHKLYIEDNPWDCACRNAWLLDQPLIRKQSQGGQSIRCSTPEEIYNMSLFDVPMSYIDCPEPLDGQQPVDDAPGPLKMAPVFAVGVCVGLVVAFSAFCIYCWLASSRFRGRIRGVEPEGTDFAYTHLEKDGGHV